MLRLSTIFLFILIHSGLIAQRVYWASSVLDFSSELSPYEYSAEQILGKPNALPQGGDNPNAWMPAKPNKLEFISVAFDKPIRVEQIVIAESYNPSAVYEIYLYNKNGDEFLVHTFDPRPIDVRSRLLRINIEKTQYQVEALRIIIDGRRVPGYSGIDAIGVSGSKKLIEIKIEEPQNLVENIVVEQLSENINSPYEETRPLVAPNGKTLYFSRANHPQNMGGVKDNNDIWFSTINENTGSWQKAQNIGAPLNNVGENFISSITPDGNSMVVILGNEYVKGGKMKPGVSVSTKTSEGWSKPQTLDIINAYIESSDGNYFLANNRKVLIMSIDRYDTYGGKDLFVSFLQRDNRWTEPLNLGDDVNSAHMESSPYLAADNETLYFSSKGFSGYGGNDVYISRRLDETWTNWTEPENLGPDINSIGDDVFFNIPPSGKFAYYAKSEEEGKGDIYKIAMPIFYQPTPVVNISGKVLDAISKEPLFAKISYNLLPENTNVGFTYSDSISGEYEILLPAGSAYDYTVESAGYKNTSSKIDLLDEAEFKEINRLILMEKGQELIIPTAMSKPDHEKVSDFISGSEKTLVLGSAVLFDFASSYLNEKSYPILDRIKEFMITDTSIKLLISGHTDNIGPSQFNLGLSQRRAESVLQYFVKSGISKSRLKPVGYGMQKPIVSNDTEKGRSINRRVEFSIID